MKKEYVIEAMKELPQEFDLDELLEKLVFMEKVEKGLSQLEKGETKTHEQVEDIITKW
jgi:hypothetical protein